MPARTIPRTVIPAKAGIHTRDARKKSTPTSARFILHRQHLWISTPPARPFGSAFAGMTMLRFLRFRPAQFLHRSCVASVEFCCRGERARSQQYSFDIARLFTLSVGKSCGHTEGFSQSRVGKDRRSVERPLIIRSLVKGSGQHCKWAAEPSSLVPRGYA